MTPRERRGIRVIGRVQGVSYRAAARAEARRLELSGFARNEPDGSVLIEVEGDPTALAAFATWCEAGPPAAAVQRIEVAEMAATGSTGFAIR